MRIAWILKDGRVKSGNDHLVIAKNLFPNACNPEWSCVKAGFIKSGYMYNESPMMDNFNPSYATQAQINTVARLWDEHYSKNKNSHLLGLGE